MDGGPDGRALWAAPVALDVASGAEQGAGGHPISGSKAVRNPQQPHDRTRPSQHPNSPIATSETFRSIRAQSIGSCNAARSGSQVPASPALSSRCATWTILRRSGTSSTSNTDRPSPGKSRRRVRLPSRPTGASSWLSSGRIGRRTVRRGPKTACPPMGQPSCTGRRRRSYRSVTSCGATSIRRREEGRRKAVGPGGGGRSHRPREGPIKSRPNGACK